MTHWLHYHAKDGVEERRRKHPRMPFDRISTSKALPSDLKIGDTIWGFTRIEKEYYLMGSLVVQWFGNAEDVPENVTSESLFNHKKYAATCPTTEATPYKKVFIDEMPYCELPFYKGGSTIGDIRATTELIGFFVKVDEASVEEQFIGRH